MKQNWSDIITFCEEKKPIFNAIVTPDGMVDGGITLEIDSIGKCFTTLKLKVRGSERVIVARTSSIVSIEEKIVKEGEPSIPLSITLSFTPQPLHKEILKVPGKRSV